MNFKDRIYDAVSEYINTLRSFSDFDFYKGTGLSSFKRTGTSIQENYLLYEENAEMCDQKKMNFSDNIT